MEQCTCKPGLLQQLIENGIRYIHEEKCLIEYHEIIKNKGWSKFNGAKLKEKKIKVPQPTNPRFIDPFSQEE